MHKITCSECGKEGEVPFKPREGAPVYCRECIAKKSGKAPFREAKEEKAEKAEEAEEAKEEAEE
jgi:CxxC-x17-CxxC domain-containing protein